ncbi:hypothetical protein [Paenibacillus harenae]|uniref:YgiT-type zinc finger protein n=1 Tax=Paenibacillus harenae TaxID=306543 RepID=A0ABT9U112_PAEHA|nr:hypothetical protein [Paenibacillus harenae]MDQ0059532.1 hypothetical protein [Paenibacillus harenae]MDQ0112947.1 hypothetical protein [Paenibacillus harenae]
MQKRCHCGDIMTMKLRTVIFSGKVEIDNVPIFSCSACHRSEVIPEVKPDLTGLIAQLGAEPDKQTFLFNECNEWASLLVEAKAYKQHTDRGAVERLFEERVNQLLDLYLLAQTLNDEAWIQDLDKRLKQLSRRTLLT